MTTGHRAIATIASTACWLALLALPAGVRAQSAVADAVVGATSMATADVEPSPPIEPARRPGVAGRDPAPLFQELIAADRDGNEKEVVRVGRRLVQLVPYAPGIRLRLAQALVRTGDGTGAVTQLDAVARMGGSATPEQLADFAGRRFRSLRVRLIENAEPMPNARVAFELPETDLMPESLALDSDGSWYVGSLRHRKIVRRSPEGEVTDWIESGRDGLGAVLGIKIDFLRGELWAASCNDPDGRPAIDPPDSATLGRGALYRYRLPGGELLAAYPAGSSDAPVCFNDLAITEDGTVYATGTGGVWIIAPKAKEIALWHRESGALNGIAVTPNGVHLYVASQLEGIIEIDPATGAASTMRHPPDTTLAGIDGLSLRGDSLVGVQNGLSGGPEQVVQAFFALDGRSFNCTTVLDRNNPEYATPTTGFLVGGDLVFVGTSQLGRVGEDGNPRVDELGPNRFLRVGLAGGCESEMAQVPREQLDPCHWDDGTLPQDRVEGMQRRLSETTCAAALWFDGLFGEQQNIASARRTSGRIELSGLNSDFEGSKFRTRVHVRTKFPNLEDRLEGFFGRDDSEDFLRDRNEGLALRSQFTELIDEEDWVAGLGYSLPGTFRQRTDFRVGGKGSTEPEAFLQGRSRFNVELGQRALLRLRETAFWTNRDGFGTTTAIDLDRVLGRSALARWGTVGTWSESTEGLDWRSAFVVYHNLRMRRGIAYESFVRGKSSAEVPLQEYGVRAVYRQPFFSSWLFGEVVVGYSWPREELDKQREGSATFGFGLEFLFGRDPY